MHERLLCEVGGLHVCWLKPRGFLSLCFCSLQFLLRSDLCGEMCRKMVRSGASCSPCTNLIYFLKKKNLCLPFDLTGIYKSWWAFFLFLLLSPHQSSNLSQIFTSPSRKLALDCTQLKTEVKIDPLEQLLPQASSRKMTLEWLLDSCSLAVPVTLDSKSTSSITTWQRARLTNPVTL